MATQDTAIEVVHAGKTFRLPHERHTSIKSSFIGVFRRRKGYEIQAVLKDVSFEIRKGEFFGIVGRNGSGKSTLLKLLAGIYTPTTGSVTVQGKLTPFIELGVGFNPELTGRENVFLNGALLGFTRKEMQAMYNDIVKFAEMEKFMDQKLKNYSSGMQVRLAFSIAIRAKSDILLIDEVLAVGDQSFQEKCFQYFAEIKKSKTTVVFVTHDMSNVERFCDRVLVLDKLRKNTGVFDIPTAVAHYNELNHPTSENPDAAGEESQPESNKDLYIKKVELLNAAGKRTTKFSQGHPFTVRVHLAVNDQKVAPGTGLTLGLAFHDSDNVNLAGPNSKGAHFTTDHRVFDYYIKSLPFNMGKYSLTVALFDELVATQYDLINQGVTFFVNTEGVHHGKVLLDAGWEQQDAQ